MPVVSDSSMGQLVASSTRSELLANLKQLKNAVIGNTWKKVEVADDEKTLHFLLAQLDGPLLDDAESLEIVNETAVIIGALANVGSLTIRPLLLSHTPARLLHLIRALLDISLPQHQLTRILPPVVRALRNILVSTADLTWGHMWGVGAERKVVGTGLVGSVPTGKGKEVDNRAWKGEAQRALSLVFEGNNLSTILTLIDLQPNTQTLLPLYQLLARLIALPRHREMLAHWSPLSDQPGPSTPSPFILNHLLEIISSDQSSRRPNPKLLEAALDLLAALVAGQQALAEVVTAWSNGFEDPPLSPIGEKPPPRTPETVLQMLEMLNTGPTPVRISAAGCLTSIVKADKARLHRSDPINSKVLDVVVRLIHSEGLEERTRLCFILAALLSDDIQLQRDANELGCPKLVNQMWQTIETDEAKGELGEDLATRAKEGAILALASMASQNNESRDYLVDSEASVLGRLAVALKHSSYGVRAASCQLARALSRCVAIVRTSLIDSGVAQCVIDLLEREAEAMQEDELGERAYTVEVAATATLCNLVADFSPLKQILINGPVFELICKLISSPCDQVAVNALWIIKNATFKSTESTKARIMAVLGWDKLKELVSPKTEAALRVHAFEIVQNLLADTAALEIHKTYENAGEQALLDSLQDAVQYGTDDLRKAALYIVSNLAIGNDKLRQAIVARSELVEGLSNALNAKSYSIQLAALKALRHLIESNLKTHRPRPAMLDVFATYLLRSRIKSIAEGSTSLDVTQAAVLLAEVLDRGRGGSELKE